MIARIQSLPAVFFLASAGRLLVGMSASTPKTPKTKATA
jgi:hypothetical protein